MEDSILISMVIHQRSIKNEPIAVVRDLQKLAGWITDYGEEMVLVKAMGKLLLMKYDCD